jgi:hypothetical protein
MSKLFEGLFLVSIALWVGGLWTIGYLVAPVLFSDLGDRQLAGMVAGRLFALIAWVGLVCAAYQLIFLLARNGIGAGKRLLFWLVLAMALMAAVSLFGIQPLMAQMKLNALPRHVMDSVLRDRFATWHGISSILYLLQSLLGLWLVVSSYRGSK